MQHPAQSAGCGSCDALSRDLSCDALSAQVIHEKLGIVRGCITTIHNITNTQTLLDAPNAKKSDLRRARSGLVNLAPTSTGSATAIALIFPELKGKLNGLAVRVPLTNSSITDCVFDVSRATSPEEVNALLAAAAAEGPLKGILGFETRPLVSTDYVNDTRSGIVDAECTQVIDGTMVKIYVWCAASARLAFALSPLTSLLRTRSCRYDNERFACAFVPWISHRCLLALTHALTLPAVSHNACPRYGYLAAAVTRLRMR